ncbi:MAG: hypothetical protein U0746_04895 [Gemmataceae bacterium]
MATGIRITCPDCQQQMTVPESVRGKKVRCKGCGEVVAVPAGKPAAAKPAPKPSPTPLSEEDDAKNPYGVQQMSLAPRCPHCAYELDPPDSKVCLHCGYHMVKRGRAPSIKTLEYTGGDWFMWLGPGILSLLAFFLLIAGLFYYHYYLPYDMLNSWGKSYEAAKGDRFGTVDKAMDESYTALMFHPGIETWVVVFGLVLMWKSIKFAFKRLILHYRPPEKIIDK